jgi:hypothetical protein
LAVAASVMATAMAAATMDSLVSGA